MPYDDERDEEETDEEENQIERYEPEVTEPPARFIGKVDAVRMGVPEPPPRHEVRWKDVPAHLRPSIRDDYLSLSTEPSQWEFAQRWQGIPNVAEEISALFVRPQSERYLARVMLIAEQNKEAKVKLTKEVKASLNDASLLSLRIWFMRLLEEGASGISWTPQGVLYPGVNGGFRQESVARKRQPSEEKSLTAAVAQLFSMLRTIEGEASLIVGHQGNEIDEGTLDRAAQRLQEWRQQQNINIQVTVNHPALDELPEETQRPSLPEPIEVPALIHTKSS